MVNRYRKQDCKVKYYDMGGGGEEKKASPYQIMKNAWAMIYEEEDMLDTKVPLFTMELYNKTVSMWADRDFFWLTLRFDSDMTERSIKRWYLCSDFKDMTRTEFERWVVEQVKIYQKKLADRHTQQKKIEEAAS